MNFNKMTAKNIKQYIRDTTKQINAYYKAKGEYTTFAEEDIFSKLQGIGGKGRGNTIGLGFTGKTKEGLIYQARELSYASQLLYEGDKFAEEKYDKMFGTFILEHPDMTKEQWQDIVTAFGSVGKEILQQFDSNQVADLYANRGKEINLAQIMKDVVREKQGTGATIRQMTDELEKRLAADI